MNRPLRLGVLCHPTYGGSGVVASELALSLADRGHVVHLFSHAVPPRLARSPGRVRMHLSRGLPYPLFSSTPHDLAVASSLLTVHRSEGLDVIHAHYALPHAVSAFLARSAAEAAPGRRAPKVVTTLHGTDITIVGSDPSYAPLTQFVIGASDAATAVSESLALDTKRHFCNGTDQLCEIEVIPNFVDTERFHPDAAQGPSGSPHAVHVSNFRPVKRVPWLVDAFARATHGTQARLTLVGEGPEQELARARADEHGIEDRVAFLGERDSVPAVLAGADLFLLTSSEESFGLSALEAMASGTPVLATRVGGVPEVVRDGVDGRLVPADDLDGFARAVAELLFDRAAARVMGLAARRRAEQHFARAGIVSRYEALYRRLLGEPAAATAPKAPSVIGHTPGRP